MCHLTERGGAREGGREEGREGGREEEGREGSEGREGGRKEGGRREGGVLPHMPQINYKWHAASRLGLYYK